MSSEKDSKKWLPVAFGIILALLVLAGVVSWMNGPGRVSEPTAPMAASPEATASGSPSPDASISPSPGASVSPSPAPAPSPLAPGQVDLSVDENGMSRATVVMNTTEGAVKFKFYPKDAPNTVNRFIELIQKGFYNGLTFHRVVPSFVVQGGDPTGTGTGGSGQKLKAEFNARHHVEGTVAMARAADPNSADSQFYISLGTLPHLDHNYTVFGQVTEGMDAVRKIKVGDKINSMTIQ